MSQRLLVGLSSVIFGLAFGCHHDNGRATQPVASAGMNANGEVGEHGAGVGAGAHAQVGGVGAGAGAQVGANDQGAYAGGQVNGNAGEHGGAIGGGAYVSRNDQNGGAGLACPMEIPGVRVAMSEVKGAIALDFTTNGDVMELRQRVHQLAAPQNNATMSNDSAGGDMQGSGGREMHHDVAHISTRATVQDLPNGARVVFTPADPGQLDALRTQAQTQVSQLNQGDCSSLEINGVMLRGPNNGNSKANRVPQNQGPNNPPAPNQDTPLQP